MCKQVLFKLISRFRYDDISGYAAQISFFLLLSLFPFIILLTVVLAQTHILDITQLFSFLREYDAFPPDALDFIEEVVQNLKIPTATLSFFTIVVIWCASRGVRAIMNGIHMAFRTRDSHGIVVKFLRSFFYTLTFAVMIVLLIVLILFGDFLFAWLQQIFRLPLPRLVNLGRYLIPSFFLLCLYLLLYRTIPGKKLQFKDVGIGALFATLASLLVSKAFSIYTANFAQYTALYGSISSIIVICTWMYLFSFVLVLGAEINAIIYEITHNTTLLPLK